MSVITVTLCFQFRKNSASAFSAAMVETSGPSRWGCRRSRRLQRSETGARIPRVGGRWGFITIKGMSVGATRSEYEYEIPLGDANQMLDRLCERPLIEKTRYRVSQEGLV